MTRGLKKQGFALSGRRIQAVALPACLMYPARTAGGLGGPKYQRHQPEKTLLYQIVAQHYPVFKETLKAQGRSLPNYVQREFDELNRPGLIGG